ncbi:response regulator [Flavihumibacter sp.]|uniref:response regulator n=1 Tax=Flavihumibacter sp. TaxID=1913981 RepID=UPI002FC90D2C|nr:response regulator [Flavihumibacter sediminis]
MKPLRIFVADDDEDDRFLIMEVLKDIDQSFDLCFFTDGTALMEGLSNRPAEELPGIIIADLNMPKLNGLGALKMSKKMAQLRNIPFFILSTSSAERDMQESINSGAVDFLVKPNTYDDLLLILNRAISTVFGNNQPRFAHG